MSQPPVSGRGLGEEPAWDSRLPGDFDRYRELLLGDFAEGGSGDTCPPGPRLAAAVDRLSGPGWRCQGATDDELIGLLGRWAALESWAAAGKMGVIRELLLTLPLVTLIGLAERPGEGHGLGPLDPALVRHLAAAAARSPHSEWCVTVTNSDGVAIGHGCCKPAKMKRGTSPPVSSRDGPMKYPV